MPNYKQHSQDERYTLARSLFAVDGIRSFKALFAVVPKTRFVIDLGMKGDAFNACIRNPAKFKLKHIFGMAELLNIDEKVLFNLVADHWRATTQAEQRKNHLTAGRRPRKKGQFYANLTYW